MTSADRPSSTARNCSSGTRRTLRAIAVIEAIKGIAALAAVIGVLDLMHQDVRRLAMELIGHLHLNPDARYPSVLLHYADLLPGANAHSLILLASSYILLRALEAYGLWSGLRWGEWLGALSGGIYVPFEISHLVRQPSMINATVLMGNLFVVCFLAVQLSRRRASRRDSRSSTS